MHEALDKMTPKYTIRTASRDDYWYCYRLTKKNMHELFTRHWDGWFPSKFREGFDVNAISIIIIAGRRAGYLDVKRRPNELYIDNIQLSSSLHGRGIGTSILSRLIADNPSLDIGLTTFSDNPALRLYKRLGFIITHREGATLMMARKKSH